MDNYFISWFAVSKMYKTTDRGKEYITPFTRDQVKEILNRYGIKLEYDQLYDSVYVANMCKADFLGSSIENEEHLAKYIKDVIDDEDAYDGIVFNRWYADMSYTGIPINWEEFLQ